MLHIELNEGRETVWRYNLSQEDLYATVLAPWKRGESIELGERRWRPGETRITVLDGPHLPPGLLTMGRGWTNAKRQGRDVTREVLASFEQSYAASAQPAPAQQRARTPTNGSVEPSVPLGAAPIAGPAPAHSAAPAHAAASGPAVDPVLADAFGLELLKRLRGAPLSLHAVWRLASERHPQLEASGSLELAMSAVASLLSSGLIALGSAGEGGALQPLDAPPDRLAARVREMDGWLADSGPGSLLIAGA